MSTYLLALVTTIWDWVVAPPLNWLLSISLEWQIELGMLVIFTVFCGSIIEHYFVGWELGGEWWKERKRVREWYYYGSMEPREFRPLVGSIRRKADKEVRLAERLEGRGGGGLKSQVLHRAAWRRRMRAQALHDKADRLEQLWQAIEKERGSPGDSAATRPKVLGLMRRLDSIDEHAAKGALAELKRIGNWFDWECLVPEPMPPPQRDRLVKLLKLMAGTASLNEARNAYRNAFSMLKQNNWDRLWEAA
jgi:hypothetical protein